MLPDFSSQEPITYQIQDYLKKKKLPSTHRASLYLYIFMVRGLTYFLLFYIISWVDNPLTQPFTFRTPHISEFYNITYRILAPKLLHETSATQQSPNTIIVTRPESLVGVARCIPLASWFNSL